MKKQFFFLMYAITLLSSCSKENSNPTSAIALFHEEYYTANILPSLNNFKTEIEKQIEFTETFQTNTTQENFSLMQGQWVNCASAFSKTRVYNVIDVKSLYFDIKIYNFPVNPDLIENNIFESNRNAIAINQGSDNNTIRNNIFEDNNILSKIASGCLTLLTYSYAYPC